MKDELICHYCNIGQLIQIGRTNDVNSKKWFFVCANGCPVTYTIVENPLPKEQVEIILKSQNISL